MIDMLTRHAIQVLRHAGHEQREVAKLVGVGVRTVRRIRTGHRRSAESKDVGAAALMLAVQQAFPGAVAELVHLSDGETHALALSDRELKGRKDKLAKFLGHIRAGRFPAEVSSRTCPNCPAFFICGQTPNGPLRKKFA